MCVLLDTFAVDTIQHRTVLSILHYNPSDYQNSTDAAYWRHRGAALLEIFLLLLLQNVK